MGVAGRAEGERAASRRLAKIEELEAKLRQLKERQQAVDARRRTLESRRERKADTRRKILVGAIVLAKVDHGDMDRALLQRWLEQGLVREDDRRLFSLSTR
jgi:molecular chaperone GrpE (heat shock protein)